MAKRGRGDESVSLALSTSVKRPFPGYSNGLSRRMRYQTQRAAPWLLGEVPKIQRKMMMAGVPAGKYLPVEMIQFVL
jgi:hypothetical protein